jgi:hypothetical protein
VAAACAAALAVPAAVAAQGGSIKAAPDRNGENNRGAERVAKAFSVKSSYIRRARFSAIPPFSNPSAVSTKRLAGFPLKGGSYGILSTGNALDADNKNSAPDLGTSLGGPSIRGSRDVTIMRVDLKVPKNATCLSIRFKFLTEEYPEFVNTEFNDAFIAELDDSNWNTVSKEDPTIHAPGNFAQTADGKLISVNAAGDTAVVEEHASGTTYDGATRRLRASTPVTPGRHILYLSLFDQGDREFDSTVFLDNLTLDRRSPCKSGAVKD